MEPLDASSHSDKRTLEKAVEGWATEVSRGSIDMLASSDGFGITFFLDQNVEYLSRFQTNEQIHAFIGWSFAAPSSSVQLYIMLILRYTSVHQ